MQRATVDHIDHAVTAGAVLLAHAGLIWIAIQVHAYHNEPNLLAAPEPVIATLIPQRPRDRVLGPVPVYVKTQEVVRPQYLAPTIPEIPVDEPQPAPIAEALPQPAPAPTLTLVQRVVPKYPPRSAARREEGATRVHLRVDESGRVVDAEVINSSGHKRLDGAAIAAVRKWRFAQLPAGSAPDGAWVATEVRFVLYRFAYSRLGDDATDAVYDEEVKSGAKDEQTPGSQEALARFIADVAAGNVSDDTSDGEVARMRAALQEWGEVKSIRFTGTAGGPRWITHNLGRETVEVQWNKFEVHHERATSEWLIAVDREGTVWNARASRAPWF